MTGLGFMMGLVMFIGGSFSFVLNYGHLLTNLLSLELISLALYWVLCLGFFVLGGELFYILYFLVMVVCEGALGLSLLISLSYSHGSDYMKGVSGLMC